MTQRCEACTGDGGRGHTMRGDCMGAPCEVCGDNRYTHPEGHDTVDRQSTAPAQSEPGDAT